jgi:cellulose synthase/poly-beta-1,6-N-acetylglucosamine synthase-like glycosyltransferase
VISFIVPAHNEEQLLGQTLDALQAAARQAGTPYEIIVVDDASTDRTAGIAATSGAQVIHVQHRQIGRARNAGAKAAAGSVFVFVDADTRVGAATIAATVAAVEHGAVGGGALLRFDAPLPVSVRIIGVCLRLTMRIGRLACGAYVFATREAFEVVGGFDETLFATEELTLSRALGRIGRFVILSESVVTSARKARTHTTRELLAPIGLLFRRGPGARRRRADLDLWYGPRRSDKR